MAAVGENRNCEEIYDEKLYNFRNILPKTRLVTLHTARAPQYGAPPVKNGRSNRIFGGGTPGQRVGSTLTATRNFCCSRTAALSDRALRPLAPALWT